MIFEKRLKKILRESVYLTKAEIKILEMLTNNTKKFSSKEISEKLSIELTCVQRAVKKLFKEEYIERFQTNRKKGGYEFYYEGFQLSHILNTLHYDLTIQYEGRLKYIDELNDEVKDDNN